MIETAIGRIGVGICAESYYCFGGTDAPAFGRFHADAALGAGQFAEWRFAAPGTHLTLVRPQTRHTGCFVNKVGPRQLRATHLRMRSSGFSRSRPLSIQIAAC